VKKKIIQFLMNYLLQLRHRAGARQAAMLVKITDNVGFSCKYIGINGDLPSETAAANVLCQKLTTAQAEDTVLLLTYPPTEWCLGLLWARFVPEVYYLVEDGIFKISRQENPPQSGYDGELWDDLPMIAPDQMEGWFRTEVGGSHVAKMWTSFKRDVEPKANDLMRSDPIRQLHPPFLEDLPTLMSSCNSAFFRDGMLMKLAFALVGSSWSLGKKGQARGGGLSEGNNIGAVLADRSGRIVAWSVNIATDNPTLHAECALIRTIFAKQRSLPKGYCLYTTLEPCHMCAGLITTCCPSWTIFFGQKDPAIHRSALERGVGTSTQVLLGEFAAASVEKAWIEFSRGFPERRPNTLDFLRSDRAQAAFVRLAAGPAIVLRNLNWISATVGAAPIPTNASLTTPFGRLGLDLPSKEPVQQSMASANRVSAMNLDVDKRLALPKPPPTYQPGGFSQELAMTKQCVDLMLKLMDRGIIKHAPD
jgi:tRNA(Arg) A34 adenosine deaminase TadA